MEWSNKYMLVNYIYEKKKQYMDENVKYILTALSNISKIFVYKDIVSYTTSTK